MRVLVLTVCLELSDEEANFIMDFIETFTVADWQTESEERLPGHSGWDLQPAGVSETRAEEPSGWCRGFT